MEKKVYVVTGGGSGIGRAIAMHLPKDGIVLLADKNTKGLEESRTLLGEAARTFVVDVTDREEVRRLAQHAKSLGGIKTVFHCAGVSGSMTDRESILRINALGTVHVDEEFYSVMEGGVICDLASNSGYILPSFLMPSRRVYRLSLKNEEKFLRAMYRRCTLIPSEKWNRHVAYLVSKNFVRWFASAVSYRYQQEKGIRIFSISPGYVNTPMTAVEKGILTANLISYTSAQRAAESEEIAHTVIALADEKCSYLMGTDVLCDGGAKGNGYGLLTCFRPYKRK